MKISFTAHFIGFAKFSTVFTLTWKKHKDRRGEWKPFKYHLNPYFVIRVILVRTRNVKTTFST